MIKSFKIATGNKIQPQFQICLR